MISRLRITASVVGLALVVAGVIMVACEKQGARNLWADVLSKCAQGDQVKNVLYFSSSNNIGPGSIWKKTPDNGYIAVRKLDTLYPGAPAAINVGNNVTCNGTTKVSTTVGTGIDVEQLVNVLPAGLAVDVKRARSIEVSADALRWDEVMDGPYRDMLSGLTNADPNHAYVADLKRTGLVVGRAALVQGVTANMKFANETAAELHAKYPQGVILDGKIKTTWADSSTLQTKIQQPAYVAVQFYRWSPEGLSGKNLLPDTIPPNARLAGDSTQVTKP